ncbi:hypothetical protein CHF27_006545 [Romboutsia maritimum]|uniref:SdpI family protein n=1 Tax=Romboutsia maritimum TaxID=2020948 RepID=A0A371ITG1_9FIRM|nr:hypothetical protein [Romboutsia maritimum]RDY23776.1 hypothetical protein CHF27_006545 [Romboutsia maritimum]
MFEKVLATIIIICSAMMLRDGYRIRKYKIIKQSNNRMVSINKIKDTEGYINWISGWNYKVGSLFFINGILMFIKKYSVSIEMISNIVNVIAMIAISYMMYQFMCKSSKFY